MTAPPVHVLSYLVLGSEKDAKSREVSVQRTCQTLITLTNMTSEIPVIPT